MKRRERWYEFAACAAVPTVFAVVVVINSVPDDPSDPYSVSTVVLTVVTLLTLFATPWVFASWLLWRAWWNRAGSPLFTMDPPARLLTAAVATLSEERRDWGATMAAEWPRYGATQRGGGSRSAMPERRPSRRSAAGCRCSPPDWPSDTPCPRCGSSRLPESWYHYGIDGGLLLDDDAGPIRLHLADAVLFLVLVPFFGLPFGVIGAAIGSGKIAASSGQ